MNIKSVAVFCGSKPGNNPIFIKHAAELGKLIAMLRLKLVYGGGNKGLMGTLADSALAYEGKVLGIIPEILVGWESQHKGLSELAIVPDMHIRKKMIFERSDAAIILAGGFGTLDELFEMLTWNQLKIHDKKIYILNSDGFYNHLASHLRLLEQEGFLYDNPWDRIIFCNTPIEIFNKIS
jgi:uncharacterized protein (TIGR00730 family)